MPQLSLETIWPWRLRSRSKRQKTYVFWFLKYLTRNAKAPTVLKVGEWISGINYCWWFFKKVLFSFFDFFRYFQNGNLINFLMGKTKLVNKNQSLLYSRIKLYTHIEHHKCYKVYSKHFYLKGQGQGQMVKNSEFSFSQSLHHFLRYDFGSFSPIANNDSLLYYSFRFLIFRIFSEWQP